MKRINKTYYLFAQNKYMYLSKNTMREIVASDMTDKMKKFYLKRVVDIYELITQYLDECKSIDEFVNKVYVLARNYQEDEVLNELLGVYYTSVLSYEKNITNIVLNNDIREEIMQIYNKDILKYLQNIIKEFDEKQRTEYMNAYTTLQAVIRVNLMMYDYLDDVIESIKKIYHYYHSWYIKQIIDEFVHRVTDKLVRNNSNK